MCHYSRRLQIWRHPVRPFMFRTLQRLLAFFRRWRGDVTPGSPGDPYAWKPAPLKPRPTIRSGAVALEEPDGGSDR
jgi:hypothetical protein